MTATAARTADSVIPAAPLYAGSLPVDSRDGVPPRIDLRTLPPGATFLRVLQVNYVHVKTEDGGDLYLTHHGVPFAAHLQPQNWYAEAWFKAHRQRLAGTGTVYRIPTRPVTGHLRKSIDLCIKWSRVGQDVPLDTFTLNRNLNAEFNTPFEEFALVEELRRGEYGPRNLRVRTQRPLAIYVPPERMQLWQTGRSREKILARIARRPGVDIDILRAYILIYGWVHGVDAVAGYTSDDLPEAERDKFLSALTYKVDDDLQKKGFMVADHKPAHIIVRTREDKVMARKDGRVAYAIVDYELLVRTAEHEDAVKSAARSEYLSRQRDRFRPRKPDEYPPDLRPCQVMGVDYVYGRTESTGGALWVVGHDPDLFAYFLPERWRMRHVCLSDTGQTYYAHTKDRIHMVWKVSRVGDVPAADPKLPPNPERVRRMREHGYNCPFEKFALSFEMNRRGVKTIYPRAIYMTGPVGTSSLPADDRRFRAMENLRTPDGERLLLPDRDYITIYGYWRGSDDADAVADTLLWTPIDVAAATVKGIITFDYAEELVERHRRRLAEAGFEDLNLKADHILMSYIPEGPIKREPDGYPEMRQCNFELVRRIGDGAT